MRVFTTALLMLAALTMTAAATVPGMMNFQGILRDGVGSVVADGAYSVDFALYNAPTGGSVLWSESQTVITSGGLFSVVLGSGTPIPDTALMDSAAYLEITVETDPPLSPRTRLTSAAYSVVTASLIGEGPVHMERYDPASGASGSMLLDMDQSAETSGRVKVRFHWDSDYPSTGDSSRYDFIFTPDSTYEANRHHKPLQVTKVIDKATPVLAESDVQSTSSTTSVIWNRVISADSGIIESNSTTTPTASASGKRQHGPITFKKTWGAVNSSRTLDWSSIFTLDSGFTRTIALNEGDLTVEVQQQTNFPEAAVMKSRPFVFPHILEDRKSQKGSSGDTATTRVLLDADSGYAEIASVKQSNHHMESLDLIGAPPMGAIAIPNLLEARKSGNESAGDTAATWDFVDADSGCGETATLISSDGTTTFHRVTKAPGGTFPGAPTTVFEIGVETSSTAAGGGHAQEVLDLVAGYTKTSGITKSDLISEIAQSAGQTREHILLSRQVGVPGATADKSLLLQTANDGALARLQRESASDSSGIELFAADDSAKLVLYSSTSSHPKYPNITLKRGVTAGAEMSLGYDDAASGAMIYAVSSPAAGAQLGIGTTTPTEAFHLVGNGCYTGTFGACSDRRYKKNIETLSQPLELVKRLRGVRFDWKRREFPGQQFPSGAQIGLIAQDVEQVVPEVVSTGNDGYKSVDYAKLVAVLIEAVKAQQKEIDELRSTIEAQTAHR